VSWARRFMEYTQCDLVKIEVASEHLPLVEKLTAAGVPVIAHLGLLPQMADPHAGYTAQGRDAESALRLIEDARRYEQAGAVGLLLEAVATEVAQEITTHTELPVIGCVAGPNCDGTVVVLHDLMGWGGGHPPRRVKRYEDLEQIFTRAFQAYVEDIHAGHYPTQKDAINMRPGEFEKLSALCGGA
jgi:3-methyl-2-oxobutanoate hydroxymethyltransferase